MDLDFSFVYQRQSWLPLAIIYQKSF